MEDDRPAFELQLMNGTFKIYANGKVEGLELVYGYGHCIVINRIPEIMENEYRRGFEDGLEQGRKV